MEDARDYTRPPLGVMPEGLWREQRVEALIEALDRSIQGGNWPYTHITIWAQELVEHASWKCRNEVQNGISENKPH